MGVFLCLVPEGAAVEDLAEFPRPDHDGIRYEPAERLHVTLRYVGDVDAPLVAALGEVCAEVATLVEPVPVVLGPATEQLGRDGTLVVPAQGADHLATLVDQVLATTGLEARLPDRGEPFYGHLTLARLSRRAVLPAALLGQPLTSSFVASRLHLISSVMTEQGRQYHHVADERFRA